MQNRYSVWWPLTLLLSTIAVGLVTFVITDVVVRPVIVMWFLFVCPGMAVIRFIHLHEMVTEWALALALSLAIDTIVASIFLYASMWSPNAILGVLMVFCCCCAIGQVITDQIVVV